MDTNESTALAAAPASTSVAVNPTVRARLAIDGATQEPIFAELARVATSITVITNADGFKECQTARRAIKKARVSLETMAKEKRDEATAFNKAVIAEEKRIIAISAEHEKRLDELETEWTTRIEREKAEAVAKEAARVAAITAAIADILKAAAFQSGEKSTALSVRLVALQKRELKPEDFGERFDEAKAIHVGAVSQLREARNAAIQREQEAIVTANKLAEFDKMKADNERLQKEAKERQERDDAAAKLLADWEEALTLNAILERTRQAEAVLLKDWDEAIGINRVVTAAFLRDADRVVDAEYVAPAVSNPTLRPGDAGYVAPYATDIIHEREQRNDPQQVRPNTDFGGYRSTQRTELGETVTVLAGADVAALAFDKHHGGDCRPIPRDKVLPGATVLSAYEIRDIAAKHQYEDAFHQIHARATAYIIANGFAP